MPLIPKSGEQEDQIAPILDAASKPITASGQLGITAATLSISETPMSFIPEAHWETAVLSSA